MEGEIISARNEFEAAAAQYASVASTVVDHDDRANVLQFKLQGMLLSLSYDLKMEY